MQLWKHPEMRDVAMFINETKNTEDGRVFLDVDWWNVGRKHLPRPMGISETHTVTLEWFSSLQAVEV